MAFNFKAMIIEYIEKKNMQKELAVHLNTLLSLLDWERLLAGITPAPLVTHACLNRPFALALAVRAVTIVAPDPRPSIVICLGCPPKCCMFIFSHSNAEIMSPNPQLPDVLGYVLEDKEFKDKNPNTPSR